MKATGVVRQLDELGRVVLPVELRRIRGLHKGDGVEIFVQGDWIVMRKYEPACIFCGQFDELLQLQGKSICRSCRCRLRKTNSTPTARSGDESRN